MGLEMDTAFSAMSSPFSSGVIHLLYSELVFVVRRRRGTKRCRHSVTHEDQVFASRARLGVFQDYNIDLSSVVSLPCNNLKRESASKI